MIIDWIYNNPTWLWGTVLVALFTATSCGGLLVFHRLVHVNVRRAHNDLAGFTIAVIGVLYAVLLAFIAIATWESFSRASDIVENESDYAGGNLPRYPRLATGQGPADPRGCRELPKCCCQRGMADSTCRKNTRRDGNRYAKSIRPSQ